MSGPTGPSSPPYVPDPSGRGTVGLIVSCVVTLSLCVWTAIHLNIDPSRSKWRRSVKKLGWVGLGIFAPEVVLWRAFSQWLTARELCRRRNSLLEIEPKLPSDESNMTEMMQTPNDKVASKWSLTTGFFAVMGGFKIRVANAPESALKGKLTLTPRGVLLLGHLNLLPDVNELNEVIQDKTKADSFAKGLVCIQAGWMLLQTIARKAYGLPVTLLELNTLAHVMCALFMYVIWWSKPQNVTAPETVNVDRDLGLLMASEDWEELHWWFKPVDRVARRSTDRRDSADQGMSFEVDSNHGSLRNDPEIVADGHGGPFLPNTSGRKVMGSVTEVHGGIDALYCRPHAAVVLQPGQWLEGIPFTPRSEVEYLTMESIEKMARISAIWTDPKNDRCVNYMRNDWEDQNPKAKRYQPMYLTKIASNTAIAGDLQQKVLSSASVFCCLSLLYGGVHATEWDGHFPTSIEQTLWRISSCLVAGAWIPLLFVLLFRYLSNEIYGVADDGLSWFVIVRVVLLGLMYGFARIYLVAEAFISIRSLPVGAYSTFVLYYLKDYDVNCTDAKLLWSS